MRTIGYSVQSKWSGISSENIFGQKKAYFRTSILRESAAYIFSRKGVDGGQLSQRGQ
jgi:hypothetical protein